MHNLRQAFEVSGIGQFPPSPMFSQGGQWTLVWYLELKTRLRDDSFTIAGSQLWNSLPTAKTPNWLNSNHC